MLARSLLVLAAALSTSCFAVTDLDRFQKTEVSSSNFSDLRFSVRGMKSHVNELFEYRVIDASNVVQSRGLIVPLGGEDASLFAKGAVPRQNGPFRLDFYADHDGVPGYDVTPKPNGDHAWRLPLDENLRTDDGTYVVSFDHNTSFQYLNDPTPPREVGRPFVARLKNLADYQNKRVEVRVADASSGRVVALYRVPSVKTPELTLTVPGMIEQGVTYRIELYTDDGFGTRASIRAFRIERDGQETGLDVTIDPTSPDVPRVEDVTPP
jgi:hypothetical protein